MTMRVRVFAAAVAASILSVGSLVGSATASVIVIDDFSSVAAANPWPVNMNAVGTTVVDENGLAVIGGHRTTTLELQSTGIPGVDFLQATVAAGAGIFDFNSTVDTDGYISLLYDGGGSLNADFSGQSGIQLDFTMFDFAGGADMPITVTLSDGINSAAHTLSLTTFGAQSLVFDFAGFAGIGSVNLSSIQSIEFELDPAIGADFRISQIITVVPAPGALALLGLGLLGARTRRRN